MISTTKKKKTSGLNAGLFKFFCAFQIFFKPVRNTRILSLSYTALVDRPTDDTLITEAVYNPVRYIFLH